MNRRVWYAALALVVIVGGLVAALAGGPSARRGPAAAAVTRFASAPATRRYPARAGTRPPTGGVPLSPHPDAAHMLGQMIVASFQGLTPSASFLRRVRSGEIGGVILFGDNVAGGLGQTRRLTARLQRVAVRGGNPPLLVMTDQEGGEVRRLPGPPSLSAAAMTSTSSARAQGRAAGRLLRRAGVNVDLAPVADVEPRPNFLGSRSFGGSPSVVARRACAFASGLSSEGVAYTLKHFPGLGLAGGNTDLGPVSIDAPAAELRSAYRAYQRCGSAPLALVMVSSASYPTLAGGLPAVMSREIYRRELRLAVPGGPPLTISDDLQTPAIEPHPSPARHAILAGLDLLMYAQTEQGSAAAYTKLLDEFRSGAIPPARLVDAYARIEALKRRLGR